MGKSTFVRVSQLLDDPDPLVTKKHLQDAINNKLGEEERSFKSPKIDIVPSCRGDSRWVAIVEFESIPSFLSAINEKKSITLSVRVQGSLTEHKFSFDSNFYGFTQLYHTTPHPQGITVDIIAVTGLAAHAMGSWRGKESGCMWLKDFLPKSLPNCRTMIYGYDSKLDKPGNDTITDFSNTFLAEMKGIRTKEEKERPIILIGHSFGGIIISHCLVEQGIQNLELRRVTRGIMLFGTPHRGFNVDDLRNLIMDNSASKYPSGVHPRGSLLASIETGGPELNTRMRNLGEIIMQARPPIQIVSCYETYSSPQAILNDSSGRWERTGPWKYTVPPDSATLSLPSGIETRIAIQANHTDMVKFDSASAPPYTAVISALQDIIEKSIPSGASKNVTASRADRTSHESSPYSSKPSSGLISEGNASEISKRVIEIRTITSNARKKLKSPVKIVFTLSWSIAPEPHVSYREIAWKILDFPTPNSMDFKELVLHLRFGFAVIDQNEDNIIRVRPGDLSVQVPPRHTAILNLDDGQLTWSTERSEWISSDDFVGLENNTGDEIDLALCLINDTDPDNPICFPVALLESIKPEVLIRCPLPALLQGYAVADFQANKIVEKEKFKFPLFTSNNIAKPLNIIQDLPAKSSYIIYTHSSGRKVLEKR